jgi:hypothetical protein
VPCQFPRPLGYGLFFGSFDEFATREQGTRTHEGDAEALSLAARVASRACASFGPRFWMHAG